MKRLFTFLLSMTLLAAVPAQAQMNFGVKGGLNVSKLSFDNKVLDASNKMGWFIGPTVKFTLPIIGLGIDASALFDQRSSMIDAEDGDGTLRKVTLKQQSLLVPVNVRFAFGLGDVASLFIFAGPQFGFNIGDKVEQIDELGSEWTLRSSNLTGNVGAGVMLMKHLQVSVNYNFALGKAGDFEVKNAAGEAIGYNGTKYDGKMNTWQLSAAYFF